MILGRHWFGGLTAVLTIVSSAWMAPAAPSDTHTAHPPPVSSSAKPATSGVKSPLPKPSASAKTPTSVKPLPALPKPISPKAGSKPLPKPPKPIVRKGYGGWAPPAYLAMVKRWHEAVGEPVRDESGRPKLVLYSINRGERVELTALNDAGDFSPKDRERAAWILRSAEGYEHPIDPRTLAAAYSLELHFKAPEIRFVSGYRAPKRLGSNHGYGRAIDLVVPGSTDEEVASIARKPGFSGVGIYPVSGFVHVDVRERSYFWVDKSGPGLPNRTAPILAGETAALDESARKSGNIPVSTARIGRDVEAALAHRAKIVLRGATLESSETSEPEDHEDED